MTEDKSGEDRTVRLRRLAEERSRESAAETARTMAEQDYQRLVHELQVHQIELEMQNEELRMPRDNSSNRWQNTPISMTLRRSTTSL